MDARTLRELALDPTWIPSAAEGAAIARAFAAGESLGRLKQVIAAMPPGVWRAHVLDTLRALDSPVRYWRVAEFFDHLDVRERCAALIASNPHGSFFVGEVEKLAGLDPEVVREIAARHPDLAPHLFAPLITLLVAQPPPWVDDLWVEALRQPWPAPGHLDVSERCLRRLGTSRAARIVDQAIQAADGTFVRAHCLLQFASAGSLADAWALFLTVDLGTEMVKRTWTNAWQSAGKRHSAELAVLVPTVNRGAQALVIAEAIGRLNLPVFAEANVALLGDSRKTVREVAKLNLVNLGVAAELALQDGTKARKKVVRATARELLANMDPARQVAEADVDGVTSKHDVATPEFWVDAYDQIGAAVWRVAAARFANDSKRYAKTPYTLSRARPNDVELRSALFATFCVIPRFRNARHFIEALETMDIVDTPGFVSKLSVAPHRLDLVRWIHKQEQGSQVMWRALLLSSDRPIRSLATENVDRMEELLGACGQLLDSTDSERRILGATLASSIDGPAARELLAKLVSDTNTTVRDIAALDAGTGAPSLDAAELLKPFATSDETWGTIRDVRGAELNGSSVVAALRTEDGSFTSATLMRLAPLLNSDDAAALSAKLVDQYMDKSIGSSQRSDLFQAGWIGRLSSLLRLARTPEELQPYGFQIGKWLMATLSQLNTREADAWLHYWTRHATAPSIQREAWRRLAARAEERQVEPLAYMAALDPFVAALAPTEPSRVSVDTEAGKVELTIVDGEVSIEVDGAPCRSLPKSAASARQSLKEFRSAVRTATKRITADLEEAMVLGRCWTGEGLAAEREGCGLFRWATDRLVCWFGDELGVPDQRSYVTVDLETRTLAKAKSIRVAHVAELDPSVLGAWGNYFAEHMLVQPFAQLTRRSASFDESCTTKYDKLGRQAAKLRWRNFGATESINALDRCYWGRGARAVITAHKVIQMRSGTLSYTDLSGVPLKLKNVDPVVLHESQNDAAMLFA